MSFWKIVNKVINEADVLLLVLDARLVEQTRNIEIENKVKNMGKPLIYVITKCDLADKKVTEKYKEKLVPCVFISATEHLGVNMLRERVLIEGKKAFPKQYRFRVGVLGYPNVGKSSLINAMKGKHAAPTSIMSGYTKGIMKVRADNRIMLIDTPGVIPYKEKDEEKHAFIGTIDYTKAKNPDLTVMALMEKFPGLIEEFYGVKEYEDKEETIAEIAKKKNILKKKAEPDIDRASRMILRDWQLGNIK
jgi:ribosome biogenesis GTPase A